MGLPRVCALMVVFMVSWMEVRWGWEGAMVSMEV